MRRPMAVFAHYFLDRLHAQGLSPERLLAVLVVLDGNRQLDRVRAAALDLHDPIALPNLVVVRTPSIQLRQRVLPVADGALDIEFVERRLVRLLAGCCLVYRRDVKH